MKRWMTSLAPNRRTKFVSFTSRLLGKWPSGTRRPLGRAGQVSVASASGAICTPPKRARLPKAVISEARVVSGISASAARGSHVPTASLLPEGGHWCAEFKHLHGYRRNKPLGLK